MTWLVVMIRPRENGLVAEDEADYQPGDVVDVLRDNAVDSNSFSAKMTTAFLIFHTDATFANCRGLSLTDRITEAGVVKEAHRRFRVNVDILHHQAHNARKAKVAAGRLEQPETYANLAKNYPAALLLTALEDCRDGDPVTWAEVRAHRDNIPLDPQGNRDESDRVHVVHNRAGVMKGGHVRHVKRNGRWKVKTAKRGPHHLATGAEGG